MLPSAKEGGSVVDLGGEWWDDDVYLTDAEFEDLLLREDSLELRTARAQARWRNRHPRAPGTPAVPADLPEGTVHFAANPDYL